jgi:tetratricopeptide (TPR) repeat protein
MRLSALLLSATLLAAPGFSADAAGLSGAYLAGRQAAMAGDFEAAAQYFTLALTRDPGNAELMENVVTAQIALGQIDRGAPVARRLEDAGFSSQIAAMTLVGDLGKRGDFEGLLARIEADKGIGPLVDGLVRAWAQLGAGAMSDALVSFDKVSNERGLRSFALYHKALALASVGDFEGAEAIFATDSATGVIATRRGVMARIEGLSQLERNADAMALLDTSFGSDLDPGLADMRTRLEAGEMLPFTHVNSPRDGLAEVFYTVATALNTEAEDDYTLLYSRVAEHLRPEHSDAILLSAALLEKLERYELAVATYRRIGPDNPSFHAAELGRADSLRRSGRLDAAEEVLVNLTRSHGDQPSVYVTLGDLMRQKDDFAQAVGAYDKALSLYSEETQGQWFIYYARAISHERLGDWPEAESDFRTALRLNPGQPQVLNYLGYSLVEQRIKLDEALELIRQAVDANPDSGYIVDSLGWVLYRLGRYDEAIGHMERAAELMPVDPVVNDHLGDVLWAVGRQMEAEFHWRRALSFIRPDSDLEEIKPDRIRRKLEVGLDKVLAEEGSPPLTVANDG